MDKEPDSPGETDRTEEPQNRTRKMQPGGGEITGAEQNRNSELRDRGEDAADSSSGEPETIREDGASEETPPPSNSDSSSSNPSDAAATHAAGSASEEFAEQAAEIADGNMPEVAENLPSDDGSEALENHDLIGTVLDGRYEITSEIAKGGMGVVFRAEHQTLERDVVVKVLRPEEVQSSTARARFEREARRVCQLDHPNIVTVHDFGYHDSLAYLVMEYVDGITVSDYIKEHGPLTFLQFAPVMASVLKGLAEAHRFDVVHRDIKSANIMLEIENEQLRRVKILDFGLAKLVEGEESQDLTKQSELIGTVAAMAPERILGKESDQRVDLYAAGITAYRMVTGERPFTGEDVRVLYQHVHDLPPLLSDHIPPDHEFPEPVVEFVHRLLAKDPDDRPDDAEEAKAWLYGTIDDSSIFRLDEQKTSWAKAAGMKGGGEVTPTVPDWTEREDDSSTSYRSVVTDRPDDDQLDRIREEREGGIEPRWLAAGIVAVSAAIVGGSYLASSFGLLGAENAATARTTVSDDSEPAAGSGEGTASNTGAAKSREEIERAVDKIGSALEEGNYGVAKSLLEKLDGRLEAHPELLARAEDYRTQMKVDRRLDEAKRLEEDGEIEAAISKYESVLSLRRNHETARSRLEELEESIYLQIESNVEGTVYADGEPLGTAPVSAYLSADTSSIQLKDPGYRTWKKTIAPDGGTRVRLEAELSPIRRRGEGGGSSSGGDKQKPSGESSESKEGAGGKFGEDLMEMGPN